MTQVHPPLLIFSDLDGTLLDHDTYDWSPARPALDRLARLGGGVVLSTSKTAAEVGPLRDELGLSAWPAIVENGAGILEPGAHPAVSGDYARLRAELDDLPRDLRKSYTGFGDLDAAGVAGITGLPTDKAELAKARAFSEPGIWTGDERGREAFVAALGERGITARMGGRFLTLSFGRTKADAMAELVDRFAPRHTMALGDAPNDAEMIEAADFGVIIPNSHGAPLPPLMGEAEGRITRAAHPGPEGWNLSVGQVIDELELSRGASRHG